MAVPEPVGIRELLYSALIQKYHPQVQTMQDILEKRFECPKISSIDEVKKAISAQGTIPLIEASFGVNNIVEQFSIRQEYDKNRALLAATHPRIRMQYSMVSDVVAFIPGLDIYTIRIKEPMTQFDLDLDMEHKEGQLKAWSQVFKEVSRLDAIISSFSIERGFLYHASPSFIEWHERRIVGQRDHPELRVIPLTPLVVSTVPELDL